MKLQAMLLWGAISLLALQSACQTPVEPEDQKPVETKVSGTVIRSDNLTPVAGTIVSDINGLARDTSKADGSFTLRYQLTAAYVGKVIATRGGFGNDTVNVSLTPGRDTTITLKLKADAASPGTGGTRAASIVLVGATETNISIRGSGGNETATLTFEVRDSLGLPVGATNKAVVNFVLQGGPGGGEYIFPVSAETDPLTGRVTTRVTSGTRAGVLQVVATAPVGQISVRSSPVRVTISGGLPVQQRFTISVERLNVPGGVIAGFRNRITVYAGDKEGNPVRAGTAVYFRTNGGIIQPVAETSADGIASVELITGNPMPPGGVAWVVASTIGEGGVSVRDSAAVIFSGPTVLRIPDGTFEVLDGGTHTFNYTVSDPNGNPLSPGTTIKVSVSGPGSGDLELSGDTDINLQDTQSQSFTQFSVTLRDRVVGGAFGPVEVKIEVQSQNGNVTRKYVGTVREREDVVVVPPTAREPSQVFLDRISTGNINVAGVGGKLGENAVLTFQVKDSLGVNIDGVRRVHARFIVDFFPNTVISGGTRPRAIPEADSSDNNGVLRTSIVSGTQAGVIRAVARITTQRGRVFESQPVKVTVHSGFPAQSHFRFITNAYSFAPNPQGFGSIFTATVGDTFSNPVDAGTALYFQTWAGSIQTGNANFGTAYTDENGRASVLWIENNPTPDAAGTAKANRLTYYQRPGHFWVVAQTIGRDGVRVADSVLVNWVIGPIAITGLPPSPLVIPRAGTSAPINLTITDARGNPLPVGTTFGVSFEFTSDIAGIRFGSSGDIPSTGVNTLTNYPGVIYPGPKRTQFTFSVSDLSTGGGATVGQRVIVTVRVNAPNVEDLRLSFDAVVQ